MGSFGLVLCGYGEGGCSIGKQHFTGYFVYIVSEDISMVQHGYNYHALFECPMCLVTTS